MPGALKCCVEVTAGILPGQPIPERTRQWHWTAEQQEGMTDPDEAKREAAKMAWITMLGASREYAATLENPGILNWVERRWIWY